MIKKLCKIVYFMTGSVISYQAQKKFFSGIRNFADEDIEGIRGDCSQCGVVWVQIQNEGQPV